jgi:hypothetical protein
VHPRSACRSSIDAPALPDCPRTASSGLHGRGDAHMNTRTIAIAALVIAVIILLIFLF